MVFYEGPLQKFHRRHSVYYADSPRYALVRPEARQLYSRKIFDEQREESPKTVDWKWVISWLEGAPAIPYLPEIPFGFRLIDVEKKKVIRAPVNENFQYACLSYVWGEVKEFQATKKNVHLLEEPGILNHEKVPATIQDAMVACRNLGLQYLWVDRLCILQDDDAKEGEKHSQIKSMGSIYHHAAVTLVAMQGTASFGLYGMSRRLTMGTPRNFDLKHSEWANRGCTYQEAILSRRLVMFTTTDIYLEHNGASDLSSEELSPFAPFFHCKQSYAEAVMSYTKRELGDPNDILNAFDGVCSLWYGEHRFGLPIAGFDDAAQWLPSNNERQQRPYCSHSIFPTWSWASVKGSISIISDSGFVHVASWAFVNEITANGDTSMAFPKPQPFSRFDDDYEMGMLACTAGCMPVPLPGISGTDPRSSKKWARYRNKWRTTVDFWDACQGYDQVQRGSFGIFSNLNVFGIQVFGTQNQPSRSHPSYLDKIPREQKVLAASPGRVLVFSQAASLEISLANNGPDGGQSCCGVCVGGKMVGLVSFNDKAYKAELRKTTGEVPLIALSITQRRWDFMKI